jgi:hypothetical protein
MEVAPTALFLSPISINSKTSEVDVTGCMLASGTAKPLVWTVDLIPRVCKSRETEQRQSESVSHVFNERDKNQTKW